MHGFVKPYSEHGLNDINPLQGVNIGAITTFWSVYQCTYVEELVFVVPSAPQKTVSTAFSFEGLFSQGLILNP